MNAMTNRTRTFALFIVAVAHAYVHIPRAEWVKF